MSKYTKLSQFAPLEQKLNSYDVKGDCWEYRGCHDSDGYCQIMVNRRLQYAHRLAWEFYNHREIPAGMTVDHICFNRGCINPKHLRLMKRKDNAARHQKPIVRVCQRHNCKKRISWYWSSRRGRMVRYAICPECSRERAKKYRDKKCTATQTVRDGSAKAA